ncbi:MAG: prepilin peptidase [Deltaproteobacteria bacterium]|nr:prepilin peptidase [Deltaproteobacteria bacterium]
MIIVQFIFGAIIGSFLSVCIYRIPISKGLHLDSEEDLAEPAKKAEPEEKISIAYPRRSFCPHCKAQLSWYHNIPILSWLVLRGKCAFCKAPISARYPVVELMTALVSVMTFQSFGMNPTGAVIFIFCAALIVISFIDYDYYIIPNVISLPGTVIALVLAGINQFYSIFKFPIVSGLKDAGLGILAGAGFLLFISEVYLRLRKKEGLGMGDVKLLAMTGALFGLEGSLYTIFIGSFLGSILGVLLVLCSGRKMSQQLPFGPYLALGTFAYIFAGSDFIFRLIQMATRQ